MNFTFKPFRLGVFISYPFLFIFKSFGLIRNLLGKQGEFITNTVLKYLPQTKKNSVHTDYHFGGYAKTTPELLKFLNHFASKTGILTDPVYTSKLFYAVNDLVKKGYFKKGETILAIHTGGLTGLLSEKMLNDVQKSIL